MNIVKDELNSQETQAMIRCADFVLEMLQKYVPARSAKREEEKAG